jgi:hypothetical protein
MAEGIEVGNVVRHKANRVSEPLVVLSKEEEHGNFIHECRWYNKITGSYEKNIFYGFELSGIRG